MLVNLRDFLASGQFGPVPFGCSRRDLGAILGEPEATGGVSRKYRRPTIWKYGDVEFVFSRPGDKLEMVHIDRFNGAGGTPEGSGMLQIEPWIVREEASFAEFAVALRTTGLAYSVRTEPRWNQETIVLSSGVEVRFVCGPDQFSDFVGLFAVTRKVDDGR